MIPPSLHILGTHQMLPEQTRLLETLSTSQALFPAILCIAGAMLMLFGYKTYRWIVVFNCIALGYWLGDQMGQSTEIAIVGSIIGAALMGVIAMPLMKYAVAVCGGLVGAVIGMVVWAYCNQPLDMVWAGGLVGLVVLGMLSFTLFKTSVILFTSIQGAAMFVLGCSALLIRYSPADWAQQVGTNLNTKPALLPILVCSIAMLALFWQHQRHGLIGNEGAPAGGGGGGGGSKPAGDAKKK